MDKEREQAFSAIQDAIATGMKTRSLFEILSKILVKYCAGGNSITTSFCF
ncbi:MAG: hypothetical protein RMX96_32180 [Nostoc sp. ChiSLP02]|nr:hypothetical protein [Nostoc sp. DedSLP05]MDZ8100963.1 hypothetical protein [Nostoc sp. DedSLP01]MDZ8189483.1 hypothetical protein [Nostoc sp. ChiSLP02]